MRHLLMQSLNDKKPVEIIYLSKNNSFSKRAILVKAMGETYIKAYCLEKKAFRIFKLDSILAAAPIMKKRFFA